MQRITVCGLLSTVFCALLLALLVASCGHGTADSVGPPSTVNRPPSTVGAADDDASPPPCWDQPGDGAASVKLKPRQEPSYYVAQSLKYFDTLDSSANRNSIPNYSPLVARWEWPPWLKLTGLGSEAMIVFDRLLTLYPTTIPERNCRAFTVEPFGRCHVVFYYEKQPCAIYEEFTFNDQGEMTFIEAWSDIPGLLPDSDPGDYWAEDADVHRLSTKVPGLGNADGLLNLDGECMQEAANADPDVADFLARAKNPVRSWIKEFLTYGKNMMSLGCK
jgi:hypothetical protein